MSMKYGIAVPQGWPMLSGIKDPMEAYETMTRAAQTADECGYESLWLADHLGFSYGQHSSHEEEMLFECWTSTAALARDTKRIRLGQAVTCNGYRNPALLAKMASTVDVLSHGRLILGIGSGDIEQEFHAYGYPCPTPPERLRQLREAVQIILAMWKEDEATFEGAYYQVHSAINQPKGVQQPHIPLLIGGAGEKVTLKMVAQYADACNIFGDPATIAHKLAVLKAHCEAVGRDYESIWRTATMLCAIGDTDEQALASISEAERAFLARLAPNMFGSSLAMDHSVGEAVSSMMAGDLSKALALMGPIGSPETIRKSLAAYEAVGVQEVRLHFLDGVQPATIRRFAKEFIG
jgi:F420-dependent oxidoreductase-like protein